MSLPVYLKGMGRGDALVFENGLRSAFHTLILHMPVAASYTAVAEPALSGVHVLVSDLYGQESLLIGKEQGVFIRAEDGERQLVEVAGRVTALAVGDVTGDFRHDLAVGTDRGVELYIYIQSVTAPGKGTATRSICGIPWSDWECMISTATAGEMWWRSRTKVKPLCICPGRAISSLCGKVRLGSMVGFEVPDVDQNGYPDLIIALRSGYVAVLTWGEEEFVTLWENYPWGAVESLVIIPHATSPEWLVVTSQKMLYAWRWQNGEVTTSRKFEAPSLGGAPLLHTPGRPLEFIRCHRDFPLRSTDIDRGGEMEGARSVWRPRLLLPRGFLFP